MKLEGYLVFLVVDDNRNLKKGYVTAEDAAEARKQSITRALENYFLKIRYPQKLLIRKNIH